MASADSVTSDDDGEPADVRDLLDRCYPRLLSRIRWIMGDSARRLAESGDFVGSLITRILEDAQQLRWRNDEHFLNLATRIARHLIVDQVRRPRVHRFDSFTTGLVRKRIADTDGASPSRAVSKEEAAECLLAALESLEHDHQRVIELRHFEDKSFREIGEEFGRSEAAVQQLHARALKHLGSKLEP